MLDEHDGNAAAPDGPDNLGQLPLLVAVEPGRRLDRAAAASARSPSRARSRPGAGCRKEGRPAAHQRTEPGRNCAAGHLPGVSVPGPAAIHPAARRHTASSTSCACGPGRPACSPGRSASGTAGGAGTSGRRPAAKSGMTGPPRCCGHRGSHPRRTPVQAADHVEQRGLAGAVRADDAADLAAADAERNVIQCRDTTEPLAQPGDFKDRPAADPAGCRVRGWPGELERLQHGGRPLPRRGG